MAYLLHSSLFTTRAIGSFLEFTNDENQVVSNTDVPLSFDMD